MVAFTIYGNPKSKKNSQKIIYRYTAAGMKKIPCIVQSDAYQAYAKDVTAQLKEKGIWGIGINEPVNVRCRFFREDRRRCDLTNLLAAIDDILVDAGVIQDDNYNIIMGHDGSRVFYDKENPRTEIMITREGEEPLNDDYIQ